MSRRRPERIRVVVADDHPIYREGMVRAIGERVDLELVGEASSGRQALARIEREKPDIGLLDIRMPDLDGLEVLAAVMRDDRLNQ